MSWTSLPPSLPRMLQRHPALLVQWLQVNNRWRRWRQERGASSALPIVVTLAAVPLAVAVLAAFSAQLAGTIATLADYWLLAAAITAVYAATSLARRWRQVRNSHFQSWLIAAPIEPASVRRSHAIRIVIPTIAQFSAVAVVILAAELLSGGLTVSSTAAIGAVGGGLLLGGLVAWLAQGDRAAERLEDSRYVPRVDSGSALQPNSAALAGWPIAQVLAWSRPENSRYILVVALFAVQGGSSAVAGLSVVVLYLLASYLVGLLSAVQHVAKSAALWLRATPMALGEFVWTLSRRVLLHQLSGTMLAGTFMLLLGAPLPTALQFAALWLVLAISISGFALVDSYRGRSPTTKLVLSLATVAALAALWQLREGAKA